MEKNTKKIQKSEKCKQEKKKSSWCSFKNTIGTLNPQKVTYIPSVKSHETEDGNIYDKQWEKCL